MEDCIFCKIVSGELPSYKVVETGDYLAFLDIGPVNHGHTLVIPKQHYKNLSETPDDVASGIIQLSKKVGTALMKSLGVGGFNVTTSNGKAAGQDVDHVHFHVIPRFAGDGHKFWQSGTYQDGEAEEVLAKIKKFTE